MAEKERITPDLRFVRDLQAAGGEAVKKCYQCATCSVACPLAPPESPFPRKEMLWAQWGLKDRFVGDIDIWLCHNCQTCSELCPRGARPGDVLAAARTLAYRDLVAPAAIGTWMRSPRYLPRLIAIPAVLYLLIWGLTTGFGLPAGEIVYGKVFPGDYTIDPIFGLLALFVLYTFYKGVTTLWHSFGKSIPTTLFVGERPAKPSLCASIKAVVVGEIATHAKWNECGVDNSERYKGHLSLFYGFVALVIVTSIVAAGHWGGKIVALIAPLGHTPMPLWSPVKMLANVGALALLYGLTMLTRRRVRTDPATATSSYDDWYLLGVLWAVALTGLGSEVFRLAGAVVLAYPTYYLHLVAVFMLIAYLPWSKLGHLVYRTTALVYAHQAGRLPLTHQDETILRL